MENNVDNDSHQIYRGSKLSGYDGLNYIEPTDGIKEMASTELRVDSQPSVVQAEIDRELKRSKVEQKLRLFKLGMASALEAISGGSICRVQSEKIADFNNSVGIRQIQESTLYAKRIRWF